MQRAMSDGRQHWPRGVRVRLAWTDRLVRRRLGATFRIRLVHPAFLSRLSGTPMFELGSVYKRGSLAAREMWMDFVVQADGERRLIGSSRAQTPSTPVGQPHAPISPPATTIVTTVQRVVERDILHPVFSRRFESNAIRSAEVSAAEVPGDRPAGAPPLHRADRRVRELPPILLVSRPALPLSAVVVRREVLPAAGPVYSNTRTAAPSDRARRSDGPVHVPGSAVPEPSLVDRLYASPQLGAALEPLSLRVFAPSPIPGAPAASSEGGSWTLPHASTPGQPGAPVPGTAAGVQTRLSRAELDLLVNRVVTLLARRERLARESQGIV